MTGRMYIDVPGEGYGHASYPFFIDEGKQYLHVPSGNMVLAISTDEPGTLESYFNGILSDSRALQSGDINIPLSELVQLIAGEASFRLLPDAEDGKAVDSTVYVFVDDYIGAYQANQDKQYKLRQKREEERRLAAACPPPVAPATYQDKIDEQLKLSREATDAAAEKLRAALELCQQANGPSVKQTQEPSVLLQTAGRASQEAARLTENARRYLEYAEYYQRQKDLEV